VLTSDDSINILEKKSQFIASSNNKVYVQVVLITTFKMIRNKNSSFIDREIIRGRFISKG
jgi:hypothetical protein